ncbi:BCS1 N terminal-domain-containing protein [Paraphoma chrysanthemicola]|uniref:BCS1 N terminal-domain-containing protein n=1 Tax=Paraphoma chrysanthemicola TaxID=798071 RepID=A0A8K0VV29_9PLEO|nr:BCS1 N terminal-domain-containing protein [Paraphoma chrysanthemicola]
MADITKSNSTTSSLPSALLDATVPGYTIISQIILRTFGIDIGLVVSGCLVIFGLIQGWYFLYSSVGGYYTQYFTSSIDIDDDDGLFHQVVSWVATQRMTKISRALRAVSRYASDFDGEGEDPAADDDTVFDNMEIFNYDKWASKIPPRYEPNFGSDSFSFKGRTFNFRRQQVENKNPSWYRRDHQIVTLRCTGRSTRPIKDLLIHIKRWNSSREAQLTSVYRPTPKSEQDSVNWKRQATRSSRPIDTVALDPEQKAMIIQDINEYFQPATARWYAARGIPYRRGYLFHGSPGTGKTSLSFALAGIFGVGVYCISLSEVGLTEAHLSSLFSRLPKRCIVLLEDIDSAGLRREGDPALSDDSNSSASDTDGDSSEDLTKITKISKDSAKGKGDKTTKSLSLISLSGLLNVIDGAASHEGRVLIMSTNCPEKLDEALVRPGRVDLQIRFTLATRSQIRDIFVRMYTIQPDESKFKQRTKSGKAKDERKQHSVIESAASLLKFLPPEPFSKDLDIEEITKLAQKFAEKFPEEVFSPAEIQGFLLMHKTDPAGALEKVGVWKEKLLEAKRKGKKIIDTN